MSTTKRDDGQTGQEAAADRKPLSVADSQRLERRARAMHLRNRGLSYEKIADELNVSTDTVARDIRAGLRAILREPAEEMVSNQRSILRDIQKAMYPYMVAGDEKAADRIIKTLDHEAKLFGLYAPERVSITAGGGEDFATTAVRMMQELGITPPAAIEKAGAIHPEGTVDGPPVVDAEVVSEVAEAGPETGGLDEWVNT